MKNGKRPTLAQKRLLQEHGLIAENWLIVKDTTEEMTVVSWAALRKGSKKTRSIGKAKNEHERKDECKGSGRP